MRTKQDNLIEDRVDDLARRLRAVEDRLGEIEKQLAEASAAERRQVKPYLTQADAAQYLGVSESMLEQWRCRVPDGPPYRKLGKRVVYAAADLDRYMQERCAKSPIVRRTPAPC